MRAHFIFEKFKENSDPIEDLGIGYDWKIITKGTQLPDDFLIDNGLQINRDKYIIEMGFSDDPSWRDEYTSSGVSIEIVGAIVIGSTQYAPIHYRRRKSTDEPWDVTKTFEYKHFASWSRAPGM